MTAGQGTTHQTTHASTASLALQFVDLFHDPIEGLHYEIRYDDGSLIGAGTSAGLGTTAIYHHLQPDADILIAVKRDGDGKFKTIAKTVLSTGHQEITLISPKIKLEAETQPALGAPGTAHMAQPPLPPSVDTLKSQIPATPSTAASTTYTVQAGDYPGKIAAKFGMTTQQFMALNPQIKDVTKMQIGEIVNVSGNAASAAPTVTPKPMSNTAAKTKPTITTGRDGNGLPIALYVNNAKDWLGRVVAIPYNWSIWQNAQAATPSTQGHPSVNPPSNAPAVKKNAPPSSTAMEHLQALMAFAEEQVKYKYGEGTRAILKKHLGTPGSYKIGTTTFPSGINDWPTKKADARTGICQVYVNIALAMAGYWNGLNQTSVAKESGKDWLAAGFTNVMSELR